MLMVKSAMSVFLRKRTSSFIQPTHMFTFGIDLKRSHIKPGWWKVCSLIAEQLEALQVEPDRAEKSTLQFEAINQRTISVVAAHDLLCGQSWDPSLKRLFIEFILVINNTSFHLILIKFVFGWQPAHQIVNKEPRYARRISTNRSSPVLPFFSVLTLNNS